MEILTSSAAWTTAALAGLLSLLVTLYYSAAFSYWTKRGVYTPEPSLFFGNLRDSIMLRKNFAHVITDMYMKAEGHRFVGFYRSSTPMLLLRDLDLIKQVLLRDFQHFSDRGLKVNEKENPVGAHLFALGGSRWRKLRAKLTPTFTAGKMKMMTELMRECCDEMVSWLQDSAAREEVIDVKEVVAKFTTDVIGSCAFGLQMNSMKDPDSEFRAMGKKMFTPNLRNTILRAIGSFAPALLNLFPVRLNDDEISEFFLRTVAEIISYREDNGIVRNDFMQLLINLKKNNSAGEDSSPSHDGTNHVVEKEQKDDDSFEMTDSHIAAQCFVFFVAGFETSSTTLSCCLYELARHMDIQEKLAKEVDSVLRRHDKKITYEAIQEMKYMDQVVDESLRMYPPGGVLGRSCTKPYTIPGTNVTLDKRTLVIVPVHGLHHDPKYYPNPDSFDPERFNESNASKIPQFAYLPFGEGPRICIGLRFGRMQVKACLAALLSKYQFQVCEKTWTPLKFDPRVPLVTTPTEVWLTIKTRPPLTLS